MTDHKAVHDPKAVEVLMAEGLLSANHVIYTMQCLTAAGLAVVKVGEVPPWMVDAGCRDHLGEGPVLYDDEPCHEEPCTCRQLWMLNTEATDLLIADWGHLD
jgi:hypothetical protein